MRLIVPVVGLLVGVASGIGAGMALDMSADPDPDKDDPVQAPDIAQDQQVLDLAAGKTRDDPGNGASDNEYLRLNRQFVIPLVGADEVRGLATVSLSLETSPGQSDRFYAMEPRLRDAFLQVLFDHANMGGFDGSFTHSNKLDPLRIALLEAARREMGPDIIHRVLLLDVARQDKH
ncbi:MAG: flagellar basal body-associated protein FliL [Pseudomonadota bacterium]